MLPSCKEVGGLNGDVTELGPYSWDLLDSTLFSVDDLGRSKATVLITMDPECPMCANYAKVINELYPKYKQDSVAFFGVFTGPYFTDAEIRGFGIKYQVEIPFILDPENRLASFLGAEVTPEVFVIDKVGHLVYQGALDDWATGLGKKKRAAQKHYLADALKALSEGKEPEVTYTKAYGCIIEYEIE